MRRRLVPLAVAALCAFIVLGGRRTVDPDTVPGGVVTVTVHATRPGPAFDRRLLGTNLPAWLGPTRLADPAFRQAVVTSGATVVRMPGGSWSDGYDWLACENGDPSCGYVDAARPSDFAGFLNATGLAGMWTINVNETAQQAAALVAFFNGRTDDARSIGRDRDGVDWKTVGDWAALRTAHGHADPQPITTWEIGNEIFGGKGTGEGHCVSYAWESSWTCDGAAYVAGDDGHDGFLAVRDAMKAVDPTIAVGAVGVADGSSFGSWGKEVVRDAASAMDFYVLHHYAFSGAPTVSGALRNAPTTWPSTMSSVDRLYPPGATRAPVAVTEFNLVAGQDDDDDRLMTKAVNALFTADSIGAMASAGVTMANHWNIMNGAASNGTDYGMLDSSLVRAPQFFALALWSHFGAALVPVSSSDVGVGRLSTYASVDADGSVVVVLINKTTVVRHVDLAVDGLVGTAAAQVATIAAADPEAAQVTWNGTPEQSSSTAPPLADVGVVAVPFRHDLAPCSVTLLRLTPSVP